MRCLTILSEALFRILFDDVSILSEALFRFLFDKVSQYLI